MTDCKLLIDEKVYTTNGLCRSGKLKCNPAPYWEQDVSAAIIFIIYTGYILIWDYFHTWAPAQLVFFNPNYQPSAGAKLPS